MPIFCACPGGDGDGRECSGCRSSDASLLTRPGAMACAVAQALRAASA
eukprot:CAMPEP_0118997716 /NCGR_PEP_ID=MMETSP1173-20130426/62250_1 /TAXON_ID=1034831 /ORGANISM="Rhizochromulina marina cf, Strain CCMP1243" /LENGTH=47 /DNA_ID= /DNA_START= /DNA_END= /DNA_ORIENTATION=